MRNLIITVINVVVEFGCQYNRAKGYSVEMLNNVGITDELYGSSGQLALSILQRIHRVALLALM